MKISILVQDLSNNCLARGYCLAKILQRKYAVEIVGLEPQTGIWPPLANDNSIEIEPIKVSNGGFKKYLQLRKLLEAIDGDVIYASKPLFTSYGIGLLKKIQDKTPLILDIDEWELGFAEEKKRNKSILAKLKYLTSSAIHLFGRRSYWNTLISEKLVRFADAITVSNSFMQKRFGGTVIPHIRDADILDPSRFDKYVCRRKYNIDSDKKVVMFVGTPRFHKGLEDLVKAISFINNEEVILVIVGLLDDVYSKKIVSQARKLLDGKFMGFGIQPLDTIPEFISMCDLFVIPQKRNFATIGQIPAKVFDAMAMAKPIIATDVNDLSDTLDGCGWIVEPGNPEQLADTIIAILKNYNEAENLGKRARLKFIEKYSINALENVLIPMFEKYRGRRN